MFQFQEPEQKVETMIGFELNKNNLLINSEKDVISSQYVVRHGCECLLWVRVCVKKTKPKQLNKETKPPQVVLEVQPGQSADLLRVASQSWALLWPGGHTQPGASH